MNVQKKALEKIVRCSLTEGFYLGGGTSLAIRYNHRISHDFDFFTFPEVKIDVKKFFAKLSTLNAKINLLDKDTIYFSVLENDMFINFSFFQYDYDLLEEPFFDEELGIFIAKDKDIISMKAISIAQRGSKKDFFDLWYLLNRKGLTLADVLEFLKKKYNNFDLSIFLKAITYFEDAEKEIYPQIDPLWEDIKRYFRETCKTYIDDFLRKTKQI